MSKHRTHQNSGISYCYTPNRHGDTPVWYIVRDGKNLRIMRDPGEWKVVRVVHGKMAAAQRELRRMQR